MEVELQNETQLETQPEIQNLIDSINNSFSNNLEEILKKYNYNIDLITAFRQFNIDNSKFLEIQDKIISKLSRGSLVKYISEAKK